MIGCVVSGIHTFELRGNLNCCGFYSSWRFATELRGVNSCMSRADPVGFSRTLLYALYSADCPVATYPLYPGFATCFTEDVEGPVALMSACKARHATRVAKDATSAWVVMSISGMRMEGLLEWNQFCLKMIYDMRVVGTNPQKTWQGTYIYPLSCQAVRNHVQWMNALYCAWSVMLVPFRIGESLLSKSPSQSGDGRFVSRYLSTPRRLSWRAKRAKAPELETTRSLKPTSTFASDNCSSNAHTNVDNICLRSPEPPLMAIELVC